MMKLHLYLGKKDIDLVQWRLSLPKNTLSKYVLMALEAENNNQLAKNFPPAPEFDTSFSMEEGYDTIIYINNFVIERYLNMIPGYQRNAFIKQVLRKNIQAAAQSFNNFAPVGNNLSAKPIKTTPKKKPVRQKPTQNNGFTFNISVPKEKGSQSAEVEKSEPSSDKENSLKAALLMMAGE